MNASRLAASGRGFTLVELMVAMAIVGLLLAVSVPGGLRFYESIQYRQSVRDVLTMLNGAREQAVNRGRALDVVFDPARLEVRSGKETLALPEGFELGLTTAQEVNRDSVGAIRFYPEGGSSGGDVTIESPAGRGVMISVDWLVGTVSQQAYDVE